MAEAVQRFTHTTKLVLRAMLADPDVQHYGYGLARATGVATGTIHPILRRLQGAEWVTSELEQVDSRTLKRPRRRLYRLTPKGSHAAAELLAERDQAQSDPHDDLLWGFIRRDRKIIGQALYDLGMERHDATKVRELIMEQLASAHDDGYLEATRTVSDDE